MNRDWNIGGVFLHGALVALILTALLHQVLRWAFSRTTVYAWLWHPGLADTAFFIILWGAMVALWPS